MTSQTIEDRVRRQIEGHPFTRDLLPTDTEALTARAELVAFSTRDVIFRAGTPADTFYLVRSGVVELTVDAYSGFPQVIQLINEGSVLGWSWLFAPYVWKFDAVAATPVRTIAIDAAALRDHFVEDPASGFRVMARVAAVMNERLDATRHKLLHA